MMMSDFPREIVKQPAPNRAYGAFVYWLSLAASLICTLGPFLSLIFVRRNYLNPHYLFYAIWNGRTPQQLWDEAGGGFPGAHFWLGHLPKGDAITHLGIVIGCASAAAALLAAGIMYLRQKPREKFWAGLCLFNTALVVLAVLGLVNAPPG